MSDKHTIQFKIETGQLRVEEKTETTEGELGFFLVKPGEKLNLERTKMQSEFLQVTIDGFTLHCSSRYTREFAKRSDGTVQVYMNFFEVWKGASVSQLLESVEESVVSQVFLEMARKMAKVPESTATVVIPETAVDLLHPDQCLNQPDTSPKEAEKQAIFWTKPKEEIKRIHTVQGNADIFFNVEGIDEFPFNDTVQVAVDGLKIIVRHEKNTTPCYGSVCKQLWLNGFGWFSEQNRISGGCNFDELRKDFSDVTIRKAYMLIAAKLIVYEENKRTEEKRKKEIVTPDGAEEWSLDYVEKCMEMKLDSDSS